MFNVQPIEFFLRAVPEGLLFILAIYAFSNVKIDRNRYIISSVVTAIGLCLIRMLPINFGVHTILAMGLMMLLGVKINNIDVLKVIKSNLIYVIIQFMSEGINIFIIQNILKGNMIEIFENANMKTLYGIPSLVISFTLIFGYYKIKLKNGELINV